MRRTRRRRILRHPARRWVRRRPPCRAARVDAVRGMLKIHGTRTAKSTAGRPIGAASVKLEIQAAETKKAPARQRASWTSPAGCGRGDDAVRSQALRAGAALRDRFAGPLRPIVIPRLISKHHVTWAGASSRILTCALTWRKRGPNAMASSTCSYWRPGRLQFGACLVYIICGGGGR